MQSDSLDHMHNGGISLSEVISNISSSSSSASKSMSTTTSSIELDPTAMGTVEGSGIKTELTERERIGLGWGKRDSGETGERIARAMEIKVERTRTGASTYRSLYLHTIG